MSAEHYVLHYTESETICNCGTAMREDGTCPGETAAELAKLEARVVRYRLAWANARARADVWKRLAQGADDEGLRAVVESLAGEMSAAAYLTLLSATTRGQGASDEAGGQR